MTRRDAIAGFAAAALALAALVQPAAAGPSAHWTAPRTPWGDPDLQGTWPLNSVGRTPLQRPAAYGDRAQMTDAEYAAAEKAATKAVEGFDREEKADKLGNGHWLEPGSEPLRQTSLIVDPANGRLPPLTARGKEMAEAMRSSWSPPPFDSLADFNPLDRCITRGMPASMLPFPYNNGVRIFQSPGWVAIQLELIHETRLIPVDGRAPLPAAMTTWLGSSRGHFEGSTLVIETTNSNGRSPMIIVGPGNVRVPTSTSLHITERLTRTGPNTIRYEARVEDPVVLTAPWRMSFPWTRNDGYRFFEYACHEGNTVIQNYIHATSPRFAAMRKAAGGE